MKLAIAVGVVLCVLVCSALATEPSQYLEVDSGVAENGGIRLRRTGFGGFGGFPGGFGGFPGFGGGYGGHYHGHYHGHYGGHYGGHHHHFPGHFHHFG